MLISIIAGATIVAAMPAYSQDLTTQENETTKQRPFTIFMYVKTTDAFLALTPDQRLEWVGKTIVPILQDHPTVSMRFYDSEFFSADTSDVIVWEAADILQYQSVIERLRETKFWGPYFTVNSITASKENAFADFYGASDAVSD